MTSVFTDSKGHRQLREILGSLGFYVEDEAQFGPYSIDCYISELNMGFEFDGKHHEKPKQRTHDRERDIYLMSNYGIPIFRVKQKDIQSQMAVEELKKNILQLIKEFTKYEQPI